MTFVALILMHVTMSFLFGILVVVVIVDFVVVQVTFWFHEHLFLDNDALSLVRPPFPFQPLGYDIKHLLMIGMYYMEYI